MSEYDELSERVTRLERKVTDIAADAAAARVLAGAADRDVSEFRAEMRGYRGTLNALRETQLEHGQRLERLEQKVDGLDHEVKEGFTKVGLGMAQITALLTTHLGRSDEG